MRHSADISPHPHDGCGVFLPQGSSIVLTACCLLLTAYCLLLTGCAPPNREGLVKEVLRADPSFSQVLDKHEELSSRIQTYERELALKRSTVERTIAQLKKELATASESVKVKTAQVKRLMEPDRQQLDLALSLADGELRTTRVQRSSLGRSMATLRKTLKEQGTTAPSVRAAQDAQLDEMLRDAKRIDQEINGIKAHVRLLKIKLLLIKL